MTLDPRTPQDSEKREIISSPLSHSCGCPLMRVRTSPLAGNTPAVTAQGGLLSRGNECLPSYFYDSPCELGL
jgi:hypothetical protein